MKTPFDDLSLHTLYYLKDNTDFYTRDDLYGFGEEIEKEIIAAIKRKNNILFGETIKSDN